jgi:hypothetical protein
MIAEFDESYKMAMPKRTYLPYLFKTNCEKCRKELHTDYRDDEYLMDPIANSTVEIHFYCEGCEHDQYENALLLLFIFTP